MSHLVRIHLVLRGQRDENRTMRPQRDEFRTLIDQMIFEFQMLFHSEAY